MAQRLNSAPRATSTVHQRSERLSGAELVLRARSLAPRLVERADQANRERRVPRDSIAELRAAGLFQALQPAALGGHEVELVDFVDAVIELAQACASTAWVYSVLTSHAITIASYPAQAQLEVWGDDPHAVASSSFMPAGSATPAEGGFRLSGRWSFSSGCDYAQWVLLGGRVDLSGPKPATLLFLARMSELTIVDDWHVLGLAGTGSKTLVGEDIFVPHHRAVPFADLVEGKTPGSHIHAGPLYRCPRNSCSPYSLVSVPVGIARGAIDDFVRHLSRPSSRRRNAEVEYLQLKVAESEAEVHAAQLIIRDHCIQNLDEIRRTGTLSAEVRAQNRRDQGFIARLCLQAVDRVHAAAGTYGLYTGSHLETAFRDMRAAAAHAALSWELSGRQFGRVRLGLPPDPEAMF